MKQTNTNKEELKASEKEAGRYDALISELALEEVCRGEGPDEREQKLKGYLKDVIAERERLFDISSKMESNPLVTKFIERLLAGENGKDAFEDTGLAEFLEELPLGQDEIDVPDMSSQFLDFYKEKEMSKDTARDFVAFVETFVSQICQKEVDTNTLKVLWLAFIYEHDVKVSYEEGVVKGQNKKIESLRFERNNVDGIGPIGGGAISNPEEKRLGYIERLLKNGI